MSGTAQLPSRRAWTAVASLGRSARGTLRVLLGLVVIAMTLANGINAALRHFAGVQMRGTDELLAFSQLAIVMLGLALVTAERRHLAVDLLPKTGLFGHARLFALSLLMTIILAYATVQSFAFVERMWVFGATSMALGMPLVIPNTFVLVGFGATTLVAAGLALSDAVALARASGWRP